MLMRDHVAKHVVRLQIMLTSRASPSRSRHKPEYFPTLLLAIFRQLLLELPGDRVVVLMSWQVFQAMRAPD